MSYSDFSNTIMELRYSHTKTDGTKETWDDIAERVVNSVFSISSLPPEIRAEMLKAIKERKFIPGGRFLAQAGRKYHQTSNCFLLRAEDTREGWGDLMRKASIMLMSGGGLGIDYSNIRSFGKLLKRSGGTSSGPLPLMKTINEIGRGVMSGGKRRSAIWAGLRWSHDDIFEFIKMKDWPEYIRKQKENDFETPAPMDMTNISVILDKVFFDAFENDNHILHERAEKVYWQVIEKMCKTGEPGFSVDYNNANESLRNACCEIVSEDDSDVCVLGSINFPQITDLEELKKITELGVLFLLLGTEYTDRPTVEVKEIQTRNRRLGLGIMGLHEWLILNGKSYGPDEILGTWLETWKNVSDVAASKWSHYFDWNKPKAVRAIAPNGTISIAAGQTTSGIEPIFAVAYKRHYHTPSGQKLQYVVDPVAERLIEAGIDPDKIEDAYSLSINVEKRVQFQHFVQKYVDNAISSTVNLPAYGNIGNDNFYNFGRMLYKYLPELRGITVYPDGARGGQPLSVVDYQTAIKHKGVVFEANEDCAGGVCGL